MADQIKPMARAGMEDALRNPHGSNAWLGTALAEALARLKLMARALELTTHSWSPSGQSRVREAIDAALDGWEEKESE